MSGPNKIGLMVFGASLLAVILTYMADHHRPFWMRVAMVFLLVGATMLATA